MRASGHSVIAYLLLIADNVGFGEKMPWSQSHRVSLIATVLPAILGACQQRPNVDRTTAPVGQELLIDTEEAMAPDSSAWAEHRLLKLRFLITRFDSATAQLPERLEQVVPRLAGLPQEKSLLFDPWGNVVRYATTDSVFELRSTGPDGKERTADDVIIMGRRQLP